MKKYVLATLVVASSMLSAQLRLGVDLAGTLSAEIEGETAGSSLGTGLSLAYDHMFTDMLGVGAEYQLGRESAEEGEEGTKVSFTTVYGVGSYGINEKLSAKLRLGYAVMVSFGEELDEIAKPKGGLMFGLGVAYAINDNLGLDVGYYSNAASWEAELLGTSFSLDYSMTRFQTGLTYSF